MRGCVVREFVSELRDELTQADALRLAGKYKHGLDLALAAQSRAEELGYGR